MLATFRDLSLIEGISLISLFFIAMPLKYYVGVEVIVPLIGTTHGLLFLSYLVMSLLVSHHHKWSLLKWLVVLLAGFIPFACFILDRSLKKELGE